MTVEERLDSKGVWHTEDGALVTYDSAIELAKEQRKIDTENACKNLELLLKAIETYDNKEALISEFRKSLEE